MKDSTRNSITMYLGTYIKKVIGKNNKSFYKPLENSIESD